MVESIDTFAQGVFERFVVLLLCGDFVEDKEEPEEREGPEFYAPERWKARVINNV